MEKVFAGPGTRENRHDKFDVAQLIGDAEAKERDSTRFKDYDSDCKWFFMLSILILIVLFLLLFRGRWVNSNCRICFWGVSFRGAK